MSEAVEKRLRTYVDLVRKWQPVKNLVAPSTLPDLWRRHVADGAQALAAAPQARRWLDLGSGAGFPGLVTAAFLADEPGASVTLVESNGRKAAFLMAVARELRLPVRVLSDRIESVAQRQAGSLDGIEAVSARALASLDKLLGYAEPWLSNGALGVFHKGQDFVSEWQEATQSWVFDMVKHESRIESDSVIAVISNLRRKTA
ncbi:16S rRNA (guanine(527)-N(7))-methyltransferase RsmG [Oryzibacter oryziterrae]|uniref:16S rRNA (guanine(527)-N(7))-methyltransferase RsmG n=1 Tax=Oryzibacter oryziterrae TaxID=2766474 RepID=UPI0036F25FCD